MTDLVSLAQEVLAAEMERVRLLAQQPKPGVDDASSQQQLWRKKLETAKQRLFDAGTALRTAEAAQDHVPVGNQDYDLLRHAEDIVKDDEDRQVIEARAQAIRRANQRHG